MGSYARLGVVVRVRSGHTESIWDGGRREDGEVWRKIGLRKATERGNLI